eukprot:6214726-Pleurochrysis_carterae.AAC.5
MLSSLLCQTATDIEVPGLRVKLRFTARFFINIALCDDALSITAVSYLHLQSVRRRIRRTTGDFNLLEKNSYRCATQQRTTGTRNLRCAWSARSSRQCYRRLIHWIYQTSGTPNRVDDLAHANCGS